MSNHLIVKNFFSDYKKLRSEFVKNFENSKSTHGKRFVWDFWYDEDQYHLIRTPAFHYFSEKLYQDFHSKLVQWGRENLGCHDISPPWLSYYVDGCFQNLHSDVPHGPWAFVYSLTPQKKEFRGGETMLLKNSVLNFWSEFNETKNHEYKNFVELLPSNINQLILFDPRIPHGVTEVKGTRDPLKSRLVIHGWFVNPRPYVVGGLSTKEVQKSLNEPFAQLSVLLSQISLLNGTVSIRLKVNKVGVVESFKILTSTIESLAGVAADKKILLKELKSIFTSSQFPKTRADSLITIPLLFK